MTYTTPRPTSHPSRSNPDIRNESRAQLFGLDQPGHVAPGPVFLRHRDLHDRRPDGDPYVCRTGLWRAGPVLLRNERPPDPRHRPDGWHCHVEWRVRGDPDASRRSVAAAPARHRVASRSVYRLVILLKIIRTRLWKLQTPHRIVPITFNGRDVTEDTIVSILTFLTLFTMSILIGALLLSFSGMDFITALAASATALCNVGPGLGDIVGPAGNFSSMNSYDEIIISFLMILGRLEIFAVLMLFDPEFWRY
nr:potassium transporter TrkG [Aquisalinus flavus]